MSGHAKRYTVVSAPGKVLLAGGYLVLDRLYTGLVVATSSRFYCSVSSSPTSEGSSASSRINVRAGQFPAEKSIWSYDLLVSTDQSRPRLQLKQNNHEQVGRNKFVEITLLEILHFAMESLCHERLNERTDSTELERIQEAVLELGSRISGGQKSGILDIVVLGDNDFYSQREQLAAASLPISISSLESLPPFCPLPRPITKTNKTGLGSSAALVTSLVAGLLSHLKIIDLASSDESASRTGLDTIHSLAQFTHCFAQGKVGSGFDVSSAVYGTHIYRRFSPTILVPLMTSYSPPSQPGATFDITYDGKLLPQLLPKFWDQDTLPFRLPRRIRMMLADVDAGTETPSFVGKVLAWRENQPTTALRIWTDLNEANEQLRRALGDLVKCENDQEYDAVLERASTMPMENFGSTTKTGQLLLETQKAIEMIRKLLREMSIASQVPIEPPEQTRLLDACSTCPGVIGGGVPGAGGFDAIFLLVIDTDNEISVKAVEKVWASWKEMSVCPLSARDSDGGLRVENVDWVSGLREALDRV